MRKACSLLSVIVIVVFKSVLTTTIYLPVRCPYESKYDVYCNLFTSKVNKCE